MSTYQPGVPTGTVNLDVDYNNLRNNFDQLDTTFGINHTLYSNQTAQNGYHTVINQIPVSTTASNAPNNQPINGYTATSGYGQIIQAQINDGINEDETLFFLSGGNRLYQFHGNTVPVASQNGLSYMVGPGQGTVGNIGALIVQWGFIPSTSGNPSVTFPTEFPNNVFNVQVTRIHSSSSPGTNFGYWINTTPTTMGFTITNNDGHAWAYYWTAIGN